MGMIDDKKKEIKREKIHNLVSIFYQPTFKTFYVNSLDGIKFVKPIGIFVSLGITTSKRTLEDIRSIIKSHGYNAVIAEISSTRYNNSDQFLNTLTNTNNPNQYLVTDYDDKLVMDKEKSMEELERIKSLLTPDQDLEILKDISPRVSRLTDLIGKLDPDGWNQHYIQKENQDYRIFHRYVNYKKENDVEYRIGIFVN